MGRHLYHLGESNQNLPPGRATFTWLSAHSFPSTLSWSYQWPVGYTNWINFALEKRQTYAWVELDVSKIEPARGNAVCHHLLQANTYYLSTLFPIHTRTVQRQLCPRQSRKSYATAKYRGVLRNHLLSKMVSICKRFSFLCEGEWTSVITGSIIWFCKIRSSGHSLSV